MTYMIKTKQDGQVVPSILGEPGRGLFRVFPSFFLCDRILFLDINDSIPENSLTADVNDAKRSGESAPLGKKDDCSYCLESKLALSTASLQLYNQS